MFTKGSPMKMYQRLCVLILLTACGATLSAQSSFQILLPSYTPVSERAVVSTPDGGFCILAQDSTYNLVLVKLHSDGMVEWGHRFSVKELGISPIALRLTEDGGFLVMGTSDTCRELYNRYECWHNNTFLLRLNPHGYPLWGKIYRENHGTDVALNDLGEIALSGRKAMEPEQTPNEEEYGYAEFWSLPSIMRLDRDGEIVWSSLLSRLPAEYGGTLCLKNSGEVLFTSPFNAPEEKVDIPMAVVALSPTGEVLHARRIVPPPIDQEYEEFYSFRMIGVGDIVSTPDGGYTLASSLVEGETGECAISLGWLLAIHCDATGAMVWSCESEAVRFEASSTSLISFSGDEIVLATNGSHYEYDAVISHLDGSGTLLAEKGLLREEEEIEEEDRRIYYESDISYAPLADGGVVMVVGVFNGEGSQIGLIVNRLAPDLTSCRGKWTSLEEDESIDAEETEEPDEEEEEEEEKEVLSSLPQLSAVDPGIVPVRVEVLPLANVAVEELEIGAIEICGGDRVGGNSAAGIRIKETEGEGTAEIQATPNSVRRGDPIAVTINMPSAEKPTLTLLNIATGETIRQLNPKEIIWLPERGEGRAHLKTEDIPSGAYLLRAQTAVSQCVVKIEIQ